MGKKGKGDKGKKKMTKKEKKAANHLKLVNGKKSDDYVKEDKNKKAA